MNISHSNIEKRLIKAIRLNPTTVGLKREAIIYEYENENEIELREYSKDNEYVSKSFKMTTSEFNAFVKSIIQNQNLLKNFPKTELIQEMSSKTMEETLIRTK